MPVTIKRSDEYGMEANVIQGFLRIMKIDQTEIARQANVTEACVSRVITRDSRSKRIEDIIAKKLGLPYEFVWGSRRKAA
jgi:lambda repressor-like predicted transcriptional regulator